MAIYLSSIPLASSSAPQVSSDLKTLGALTCAYLIVKDDGTDAYAQEVLNNIERHKLNVSLRYQGCVDSDDVSFKLERPTYAYAMPEASVAIFTLPALVHYSSLPLKLRNHLAAQESKGIKEFNALKELGFGTQGNYKWWHHPISLTFNAELKQSGIGKPLSLGQIECVVLTSENNEAHYFNYLEPTIFFFDFLISNHTKGEFTDSKLVPYDELYKSLADYCTEDLNRKRSLILSIAQKAPAILRRIAPKMRVSSYLCKFLLGSPLSY